MSCRKKNDRFPDDEGGLSSAHYKNGKNNHLDSNSHKGEEIGCIKKNINFRLTEPFFSNPQDLVMICSPCITYEGKEILCECYEIKPGKYTVAIINYLAHNNKNKFIYLKWGIWIISIYLKNLYARIFGIEIGDYELHDIKKFLKSAYKKEHYAEIKAQISNRKQCARLMINMFLGKYDLFNAKVSVKENMSSEAFSILYSVASVICESARNFQNFPLTLMILDMIGIEDTVKTQKGLFFLFEKHPMAHGGSWNNTQERGFVTLTDTFEEREDEIISIWRNNRGDEEVIKRMEEIARKQFK